MSLLLIIGIFTSCQIERGGTTATESTKTVCTRSESLNALHEQVDCEIAKQGAEDDLSHIDTNDITYMTGLFSPNYSFVGDKLKELGNIRPALKTFNGNISNWDTSKDAVINI